MHDPVVFQIGQLRTATLLLLHPPFAASAEHDTFLTDPLLRFRRVGMYAYSATYGTVQDAQKLSHMVRMRHSQIKGIEPITRRPYQSNSEYELALTHVIQASSYLAIYETVHGRLTEAQRDQYYQEQKIPSAMLGVNPAHVPSSHKEAEEFLSLARKRFAVGSRGRELLAYYDNRPYEPGTAFGDLPFIRRKLTLLASRALVDMAIATLDESDKLILSINRRPKLRWKWAVRGSLKLTSWFMRSKRGQKLWEFYLQKRAFNIYREAMRLEDQPGKSSREANYVVPNANLVFHQLPDLKRNWPGDVEHYALGREVEGNIQLTNQPTKKLRNPRKSLQEVIAS